MTRIDLHVHSTASDGEFPPGELVDLACREGLQAFALTDHDTVAGIEEALGAASRRNICVVPGIEISTEIDGVEAHILGYGIDYASPRLVRILDDFHRARQARARRIVARLGSLGMRLSWDEVMRFARGKVVGRPHIASAMVARGYVASVEEAFQRYLGHGGAAYESRQKLTPVEAVRLVLEVGGTAVLAHPWSVAFLVKELVDYGLMGLEVYYPGYGSMQVRRLKALAHEYGLLCTGGSDFHGPHVTPDNPLGAALAPPEIEPKVQAWYKAAIGNLATQARA